MEEWTTFYGACPDFWYDTFLENEHIHIAFVYTLVTFCAALRSGLPFGGAWDVHYLLVRHIGCTTFWYIVSLLRTKDIYIELEHIHIIGIRLVLLMYLLCRINPTKS